MKQFTDTPKPRYWWYAIIAGIARVLFFILGGINAVNPENIPKDGPVIIAPNHLSHADPPAVACSAGRHLFFMAKEELFKGLFGRLIFSVGAFPVKRGSKDTEPIRKARAILEQGGALVLFPEGSRGDGMRLGPISKGVALLAKITGAYVVPAHISGTAKLMPRGSSRFHRSKITVTYGKPFRFEDAGEPGIKVNSERFTDFLTQRLVETAQEAGVVLLPPAVQSEVNPVPDLKQTV